MSSDRGILGAPRNVPQPIYADDEDLDAPFVTVDPFRTLAQPRPRRWACSPITNVDLEGGATIPSQPLAHAPLEARTPLPAAIHASHTVPINHGPRSPPTIVPGLERSCSSMNVRLGGHDVLKAPRDKTYGGARTIPKGLPTSHSSHHSPSPIHPPSSLNQSSSNPPTWAPAPSAHQTSPGVPDSPSNVGGDQSRRDSFSSPEQLRKVASHAEPGSKPEGVHADHHPPPPQPVAALCERLPEPRAKTSLRRASVYGGRAARASGALVAFLWRFVPTTLYLCALFRLPALYFSRVARVFENAELCRRDVIKMAVARATQWEKALGSSHAYGGSQDRTYGGVHNYAYGSHFHEPQGHELSLPLLQFKKTWEQFVDNLLHEWKVLNVISALLTSAVLTILQIDAAAADLVVRTATLLALVCTLMSLLYGCLYTVRFGSMKAMYKATEWALEAQKTTTNIFWNVWVMLAMPAVWLLWSILSFIVAIMAFVWRTGAGGAPAGIVASPTQLLASRVIISVSLALGAVYFVLVVRTFTLYGDRIDRRWRENVYEQMRRERQLDSREAGWKGGAEGDSPPVGEM